MLDPEYIQRQLYQLHHTGSVTGGSDFDDTTSINKQRGIRAASHVHVPSFHISSAGLDIILATDERLLSKVHMELFELHLSPGPAVDTHSVHGVPLLAQQSHAISCTAKVFSIHDLSLAGAMHPDVVTKATAESGVMPSSQSASSSSSSSSSTPPMLAVTYTVPDSRAIASTIRIHLHGIQVCYLHRFLQEMILFIGPNLIQAVMEKIQQGTREHNTCHIHSVTS